MRWLIVCLFVFTFSGVFLAVALTNSADITKKEVEAAFQKRDAAIFQLAEAIEMLEKGGDPVGKEVRGKR